MAAHLGVPVCELRERISFGEFVEWLAFLQLEDERHTKQDHYLAQIAAEVVRAKLTKTGAKKVRLQDYLLKFASETPQDKMQKSKQTWAFALKLDLSKN